jgi:hypothetical protein
MPSKSFTRLVTNVSPCSIAVATNWASGSANQPESDLSMDCSKLLRRAPGGMIVRPFRSSPNETTLENKPSFEAC